MLNSIIFCSVEYAILPHIIFPINNWIDHNWSELKSSTVLSFRIIDLFPMKLIGACCQHNIHIAVSNIIWSLTQSLKSTQNSQLVSERADFKGCMHTYCFTELIFLTFPPLSVFEFQLIKWRVKAEVKNSSHASTNENKLPGLQLPWVFGYCYFFRTHHHKNNWVWRIWLFKFELDWSLVHHFYIAVSKLQKEKWFWQNWEGKR